VKDLPHGRLRREGPAPRHAAGPFGFELGPFSAGRTHVMYAAKAGDAARLRWLLARGGAAGAKGLGGADGAVLGDPGGARGDGAGAAGTGDCATPLYAPATWATWRWCGSC
jgi:hypothetical protein